MAGKIFLIQTWNSNALVNLQQLQVTFKLDIADVSCRAGQSPIYLTLDICLLLGIVLIFDSCFYIFLSAAAQDYKAHTKHDSVFSWSYIKTQITLTVFNFSQRAVKNGATIAMSNFVMSKFFPYWGKITVACDAQMPGAEVFLSVVVTWFAWVFFPWGCCLYLNTFIWGYGPCEYSGGGSCSSPDRKRAFCS